MSAMAKDIANADSILQSNSDPPQDDRLLLKWIESQHPRDHQRLAKEKLRDFLKNAAQPRHASGNACIKLCYFIEQCRSSSYSQITDVVFSESTALELFSFFIEWNEKNQNRSMRQVLELVSSLIAKNSNKTISTSIKAAILERNLSIITHQAAQPLVKPAFKSLECFLGKGTISTEELIASFEKIFSQCNPSIIAREKKSSDESWDVFFSGIFDWMTLPDISPAAGKFLVTIFRELRAASTKLSSDNNSVLSWQRWIRKGLNKNPEALENVKIYLFPPLFKLDRNGSLAFLEDLNKQSPVWDMQNQDMDAQSLLRLAAIEAGKKAGLVEEPSTIQSQKPSKKSAPTVVLQEEAIGSLLSHASDTVRSLAFSVLVSSSSSIRPLSPVALGFVLSHVSFLYSDTDAKFRNEILSNTKYLIDRLRGATAFLAREIDSLKFILSPDHDMPTAQREKTQHALSVTTDLLQTHETFIQSFLSFLLGELVPTASYQRHITSLKAITLLLRSDILKQDCPSKRPPVADNATIWPYEIDFFTPGTVRLLLDLLVDPFEDVRSSATSILKLASPNHFEISPNITEENSTLITTPKIILGKLACTEPASLTSGNESSIHETNAQPLAVLRGFIVRAENASKRTGRADYADGVARSYELLYSLLPTMKHRLKLFTQLVKELESKVSTAGLSLEQAVLVAPVHGTFATLNLIWDAVDISHDANVQNQWDSLQLRMVDSCSRIWIAVKDVLCNDSPEGHLPLDLNEADVLDTKDVLSYSFRAIHESSNLLQTLVNKIKIRFQKASATSSLTMVIESFQGIGGLTFEQLSSLRHRGAFSTVSLTFARCCQTTQFGPATSALLRDWYQGTLRCIQEQASTTRRSAGIPALITGILSANAPDPSFSEVVQYLKALARQPVETIETDSTNLPQVHALNCIKEIFKSSVLGRLARSETTDCLQLAADCLDSTTWAIRNCGLLLFRSIIDNMFGTSETKTEGEAGFNGQENKIVYEDYPGLAELILNLLNKEAGASVLKITSPEIGLVEELYPALELLRRAGPPKAQKKEIARLVILQSQNEKWLMRDLAAKTFCSMLSVDEDWVQIVHGLLRSPVKSSNQQHGVLLVVSHIIEQRTTTDSTTSYNQKEDIIKALRAHWDAFIGFGCPALVATFYNVLTSIAFSMLSDPIASSSARINRKLLFDNAWNDFRGLSDTADNALALNAVARHTIISAAFLNDYDIFCNLLNYTFTLGTDVGLVALGCAAHVWEQKTLPSDIIGICDVYIRLLETTSSLELWATILSDLAYLLDRRPLDECYDDIWVKLLGLRMSINTIHGNTPSLDNSLIRISGYFAAARFQQSITANMPMSADDKKIIRRWGQEMAEALNSAQDFDTRTAAVASLRSFFMFPKSDALLRDPCIIPAILSLCDSLNDDDEDIREVGAGAVTAIFQRSLVHLAAQQKLMKWIFQRFGSEPLLAWNTVSRMTGNYTICLEDQNHLHNTASKQFDEAFRSDDSLFAIEEQNLYIDEFEEIKLWSAALSNISRDAMTDTLFNGNSPVGVMTDWIVEGFGKLQDIVDSSAEDSALGWMSPKLAYTACMRLFYCANALMAFHDQGHVSVVALETQRKELGGVFEALEVFLRKSQDKKLHEVTGGILIDLQLHLSRLQYSVRVMDDTRPLPGVVACLQRKKLPSL